jgi:hypothetical protein
MRGLNNYREVLKDVWRGILKKMAVAAVTLGFA